MNILVTLDKHYLPPLKTMLFSMFCSNPDESFDIYLISDDLTQDDLLSTSQLCERFSSKLHLIHVDENCFSDAPTLRYYSRAMYYRLLAGELLPQSLDRILYLDPDMLVIGPLRLLYDTPFIDELYAACIHKGITNIASSVNRIRLSNYETEGYYNSGMLLMNLERIRLCVHPEDIYRYVEENRPLLVLPDQDILNGMYGEMILPVDESLWNYDARKYNEYLLASQGEKDMNWVMENTAILHFCGKRKPWLKSCHGRFSALYKHYMNQAARCM